MAEATKFLNKRIIKEANKDCFILDSWFSFKWLAEAEMDFGADMVRYG